MLNRFPPITIFVLIVLLIGCERDYLPMPETNTVSEHRAMEVTNNRIDTKQPTQPVFLANHYLKGKNIFIECVLSQISFRKDSNKKIGKIIVFVDGEKTEEVHSPIFIIKGLSTGSHRVKLEVVTLEDQPYDLKREFNVTIP